MRLTLLTLFLLIIHCSFSQSISKVFGGTQNDRGEAIIECANNDLIVGGVTSSFGAGGDDIMLTRLTPSGQVVWSKAYGLSGDEEGKTFSVVEAANGDILLAFRTFSIGTNRSGILMRLTSTGLIIWQKKIGEPLGSLEGTRGLIEHPDGSIYVGIGLNFSPFGSSDGMVTKLDMNGNIIWSKLLGDVFNDHVWNIIPLPNGEIMVNMNSENLGPGNRDAVFVKFDTNGNVLQQVAFGGSNFDLMTDLDFAPTVGYVVSGGTQSYGQGNRDAFIAKFDTSLNLIWYKTYGGPNFDHGSTVQIIDNNHFVMYMNSNLTNPNDKQMTLIGVDSLGNTLYTKSVGDQYDQETEQYSTQGFVYSTVQNKTFVTNNYKNAANNSNMLFLVIDGLPDSHCKDTTISEAFHTPIVMPISFGIMDLGVAANTNLIVTEIHNLIETDFCPCPFNIPTISDTTICIGDILEYDLDTNYNYQWQPASSFSCMNCPDPTFTGNNTTQATVIIDNAVCFDTINFTITVAPNIPTNLTGPDTLCETDLPIILDSNNIPGIWSGNGIVNPQNGTFDPSGLSGNIEVYFNPFSNCSSEDTLIIFVQNTYPSDILTGDTSLCIIDNAFLLEGNPAGGTWSGFTPTVINGDTYFDPTLHGIGNYVITYTPTQSCALADSILVIVDSTLSPTFTLTDYCENNENIATNISLPGGTFSFNPAVSDGATINPTTGEISNGIGGSTYTVEYSIIGNCANSSIQEVTVLPLPDLSFYANPSSGSPILDVNFYGNITDIIDNFWDFGDGNTSTQLNTVVSNSYTAINEYTVTRSGTSVNGCTNSFSITVKVEKPEVDYEVPNIITPNNDGVNDGFYINFNNSADLIGDFEIIFLNRWGNEIQTFDKPDFVWDGRLKSGKRVVDGTYFWIMKFNSNTGGNHKAHGFVRVLSE